MGFMECSKILYHILKDKTKEEAPDEDWSGYLERSVRESLWAIRCGPDLHRACHGLFIEKGKDKGKGKGPWEAYGKGPWDSAWVSYRGTWHGAWHGADQLEQFVVQLAAGTCGA